MLVFMVSVFCKYPHSFFKSAIELGKCYRSVIKKFSRLGLNFKKRDLITDSRKIVDTRNRIIHGYDSVSEDVIWLIVNRFSVQKTCESIGFVIKMLLLRPVI